MIRTKSGAAALSIASNSLLIAIKLAAGAITGSIAIVTEAVHSLIDLIASVVAFISVRKADEPADADHPYGHEKVESLAATIEGMLILVGAGIIVFEATHRLVVGSEVETLGVGIAVMGFSVARQPGRLDGALAAGAGARIAGARGRRLPSARRRAHLGRGPRSAWCWSSSRGSSPSTRSPRWSSPSRSSPPGSGSSAAPRASLVDEALPAAEMDRIEAAIAAARTDEVAGYHKLRARRAGPAATSTSTSSTGSGTSLERAHELSHEMRGGDRVGVPRAEVLIHAEPETSFREPDGPGGPYRSG